LFFVTCNKKKYKYKKISELRSKKGVTKRVTNLLQVPKKGTCNELFFRKNKKIRHLTILKIRTSASKKTKMQLAPVTSRSEKKHKKKLQKNFVVTK